MDNIWTINQLMNNKIIRKSFLIGTNIEVDWEIFDTQTNNWKLFVKPKTLSDKKFAAKFNDRVEDVIYVDDINGTLEKISTIISDKYNLDYDTQCEIDKVLGKDFDLIVNNKA